MGWKLKTAAVIAFAMALVGCVWLGYAVRARYQGNEYVVQVTNAFNAAALVNGEETFTDPERAVVSAYEGRQYVILPENYKGFVSLLRKDCAMPMFRRVGSDAPLSITICGSGQLRIEPDPDSIDGALIAFTSGAGGRFTMHVRGGNIWRQLVEYATTGHGKNRNPVL